MAERRSTADLIAALADDLQPVRPLRRRNGLVLALASLLAAVALVVTLGGLRPDLAAGRPDAMFLLTTGPFVLLGAACAFAAVVMGSPRVGNPQRGWGWAAAMAGLLPLSALLAALPDPQRAWVDSVPEHGLDCLLYSVLLGLLMGGALTLWLRRGAPTSPGRAGLLAGIASGCAGTVAFSFLCPFSTLMHVGLWHSLAVLVSALLGRIVVPPLIRW